VVDRLQPLALGRGLDLDLAGESAPAPVDAVLVSRLLENLVGNALKFTERGGVTVTVVRHDRHVEVLVDDTGPGVEDAHAALFEPFRRGSTAQ
ncbi:sensor histidine kinase, partial [Deinococcus pimensis]|uniref:sensor histidine kinase n=1 Tax=Deinococcus pimensis TaxID=309888 RepID=UPI00146FA2DE